MSQESRLYRIRAMMNQRVPPSRQEILDRLEISPATFKRDLAKLRDEFYHPIVYDQDLKGYRYDASKNSAGPTFELPGLWFSEQEASALANFHALLSKLDREGLLATHIDPLLSKIDSILGKGNASSKELRKRIKVLDTRLRKTNSAHFPDLGHALLHRKKIHIEYYARGTNQISKRDVSPQRLINYQSNWYLDAWCHKANGLRSFSVDGIKAVVILDESAKEVAEKALNEEFASGYGIFGGKNTKLAKLKFSKERARWVADEIWHGQQKSTIEGDGSLILEVPYSSDQELLLDIQRHGSHVEVLEPIDLRKKLINELKRTNQIYGVKE